MKPLSAIEFRSRPMVVTVLDHCPECKTLQADVKPRKNFWPNVSATCCGLCFSKLIADYSGIACC
jgi:hypothetical protein